MPRVESDEFDFLHPDKNRLDEEWVEQPKLYFKYAQKLAFANEREDEAKAELNVERAEVEIVVRNNPTKYKIEKVTEALVTAVVTGHPRVQRAMEAYIKAKRRAAILDAAVKALDHRKKALENLVWLHGQNYFSEPRAKDEMSRDEMEAVKAKAAARKGKKIKRRDLEEDE
jgi:hypothetical protein